MPDTEIRYKVGHHGFCLVCEGEGEEQFFVLEGRKCTVHDRCPNCRVPKVLTLPEAVAYLEGHKAYLQRVIDQAQADRVAADDLIATIKAEIASQAEATPDPAPAPDPAQPPV